jgi:hypothetical protein
MQLASNPPFGAMSVPQLMELCLVMWHVVYAEGGGLPQSRAARSRDLAIQAACELLSQSFDVRRVIEPNGVFIERTELDGHFDGGRFPGLRRQDGIQANLITQNAARNVSRV